MPDTRLEMITRSLAEAVTRIDTLNGCLKFDLGDAGIIFLNGTMTPCTVSNENGKADCVVEIGIDTLDDMLAGRTDSRTAFVQGQMCLVGDMHLAIRLVSLLNSATPGRGDSE